MRYGIPLVAVLFVLSVSPAPLSAQGRGNGHANAAGSTQGKHAGAKADKKPATAKNPPTAPTAGTEVGAKAAPHKAPKAKEIAGTPTTPVTPTMPVTPTTPTTRAMKNQRLESRLLALLPPGSTIQTASQGFKNWGQFVAAVHVSNNLGIPFADLKAKMTGITPGTPPGTVVQSTPLSLGQAIQSLTSVTTPETATLTPAKIKNEVKRAEDAANADLRSTRDSN